MNVKSQYSINLERLQDYAESMGWALNVDSERIRKVVGLMTENLSRHGNYYCPCKLKDRVPVEGKDVVCPCPEVEMEIADTGHCFCRLFYDTKRGDRPRPGPR